MQAEIPAAVDQVKLRYLVVDSEDRAQELSARLDAGEDFQALADELREGEEASGYGTELDWLPRDVLARRLDAELADLAFDLEVGERSPPVVSQDGSLYTIIHVVGHEVRQLEEEMRDSLGDAVFQEWLDSQQILVERRTYQDRVPTEP
jgi:hypothetical protein